MTLIFQFFSSHDKYLSYVYNHHSAVNKYVSFNQFLTNVTLQLS